MMTFWQTIPTIRALRGENYHAFPLFGYVHLTEIAVIIFLTVMISVWYSRADEKNRKRMLVIISVLMLTDEMAKYAATAGTGQWNWIYLPLHLCSINIFVCLYYTLKNSERAGEILYVLSLPGAVLATLSPSWQAAPVWNFMHLHSASIHFLLGLYPILLLVGGFRPSYRRIPWVAAFLVGTAFPIYFINKWLGTNFFFLNGTGGNAITTAFANIFGADLYFLGYPLMILFVGIVLYVPWAILAHLPKTGRKSVCV